jgi:hypothetical protein
MAAGLTVGKDVKLGTIYIDIDFDWDAADLVAGARLQL